jgi:hypothetical protein
VLSLVVALADEVVVQSTVVEVHLLGVVWPVSSALVSGFYPTTVLVVAVSSTYSLVNFFVAGGNCLLLRE